MKSSTKTNDILAISNFKSKPTVVTSPGHYNIDQVLSDNGELIFSQRNFSNNNSESAEYFQIIRPKTQVEMFDQIASSRFDDFDFYEDKSSKHGIKTQIQKK